jgi:chromosome partitioning protein
LNTTESPHRHIIVFGNEKGGTGKSTTAMHVIVSLLSQNFKLAVIDLDARQKTLHRYLENRQAYMQEHELRLNLPDSHVVEKSQRATTTDMEQEEQERFKSLLEELVEQDYDFIVIDCPGSDTFLARLAHTHADTLITPLNDSFIDLDLLAQINPDSYEVKKLSLYSESVWESRKRRSLTGKRGLDWVVMRNRTSSTDAWNKRHVHNVLTQLQRRVAFRYVTGLGERVVYRELFPKGLTLIDLQNVPNQVKMSMSHVVARQELRSLMDGLRLPRWNEQEIA